MSQTYEEPGTALSVAQDAPLAPQAGIMPAVSPDEARAQMRAYQELCAAVLTDDDYQEFTEKKRVKGEYVSITKRFKKKSAVKKLQTYFGISVDVIDEATHRDDLGEGHFGFRTKARATSPGGRHVEAMAGCATHEERFDLTPYDRESDAAFAKRQRKVLARAYHDVLSTAETRATNRAVMNLVSPGEVTAEEISRPPRAAAPRAPQVAPEPVVERVPVADLQDQARSLGIADFRAWLVANVATDLATRGLRPAESVEAKRLLDAMVPADFTLADVPADDAEMAKRRALRTSIVTNARVLWPKKAECDANRHLAEKLHRVHGLTDEVLDQVPMEALESLQRDLARRVEGRHPEPDPDDALAEYAEGRLL